MSTRLTIALTSMAVLVGVLLLLLPSPESIPPEKVATARMMLCAVPLRDDVANRLLAKRPMPTSVVISCPKEIESITVANDGAIGIIGAQFGARITLYPSVNDGKVRWRCEGEPAGFVPKACVSR